MSDDQKIGVIGAGSFGLAVANLLAEKNKVLIYTRNPETLAKLNQDDEFRGQRIHERITATGNIQEICNSCFTIYPVVPSADFRAMIQGMSPYLTPGHVLIHATKGLDVNVDLDKGTSLNRDNIKTMSEVIREETSVVRVGCLAGPNLAKEIASLQPAATVIASKFDEVIETGKKNLRSHRFQTYGSNDITGIELAGVLKNYIAIATGAITGLGLGENARSLLITRGMAEMIYVGRALGASTEAFLGLAGIGDLIATCSSPNSRNFSVGLRLAKGESIQEIIASMNEVAEGIRTVKIVKALSEHYEITAPIVHVMYRVMFEKLPLDKGISFLMRYPAYVDAEYLQQKKELE